MSIDPVLERCAIEVASATRSARAAVWSSFSALLIHFSRRGLRERWYALLVTGVSLLLLVWALRLLWTGVRMLR